MVSLKKTKFKIPILISDPAWLGYCCFSYMNLIRHVSRSCVNHDHCNIFRNKKIIKVDKWIIGVISTVYGAAYPGELLAILGSSGAGKTTLLNALTFRPSKGVATSGLRCVNGAPTTRSLLVSQSAYVQQDDLFIGCLTVKEHLRFQALVRMDKHIAYHQRMNRVEEVISEVCNITVKY